MPSIVFIHGINNQNNTPRLIEETWWAAIKQGWTDAGLAAKPRPEIRVAYYADILADASNSHEAQAMGDGAGPYSDAAFRFLEIYRQQAGLSQADLDQILTQELNEPTVEHMGPVRGALVRIARAIANALPGNGKNLARLFLKQATVYIDNAGLRAKIHYTVSEQVFDGKADPTIVIGHSLGTVVGYNVLFDPTFDNKSRKIPLFVTLGSPLGIGMMDAVIPPLGSFPKPPTDAWFNGLRKDDFVPLDTSLKQSTIGFDGVVNHRTKMVDGVDPHSIEGYLRDPEVCRRLHNVL